jgi:hypothetical protein
MGRGINVTTSISEQSPVVSIFFQLCQFFPDKVGGLFSKILGKHRQRNRVIKHRQCMHRTIILLLSGYHCHNVAIKTITIHVIEVVLSITTIITYLHNYI